MKDPKEVVRKACLFSKYLNKTTKTYMNMVKRYVSGYLDELIFKLKDSYIVSYEFKPLNLGVCIVGNSDMKYYKYSEESIIIDLEELCIASICSISNIKMNVEIDDDFVEYIKETISSIVKDDTYSELFKSMMFLYAAYGITASLTYGSYRDPDEDLRIEAVEIMSNTYYNVLEMNDIFIDILDREDYMYNVIQTVKIFNNNIITCKGEPIVDGTPLNNDKAFESVCGGLVTFIGNNCELSDLDKITLTGGILKTTISKKAKGFKINILEIPKNNIYEFAILKDDMVSLRSIKAMMKIVQSLRDKYQKVEFVLVDSYNTIALAFS